MVESKTSQKDKKKDKQPNHMVDVNGRKQLILESENGFANFLLIINITLRMDSSVIVKWFRYRNFGNSTRTQNSP